MGRTRIEKDTMGEVEVPEEAYYGAQTERARQNFPISGLPFPSKFLEALGLLKQQAARVNGQLGVVPSSLARAIAQAAGEIAQGGLLEHFPLDIFQTGSGTSTNMNANEVIARRAQELLDNEASSKKEAPPQGDGARTIHPNDHVNAGQSSNDVIPTALHVSAYRALAEDLEPAVKELHDALAQKALDFDDVLKIGRTHLQDAVPLRLGQEFGGYAQQIANSQARLQSVKPHLAELALGGTAVGTGLNAPPDFAAKVIALVAQETGHPFVPAPDRFEALAAKDAVVQTSGALKTLAVSLTKIANDLRWLSSGPRCGIGEVTLPALQPGSSIMPGKVNPVIPEAVLMVAAQVMGNDATISIAGMSGNFELNVMMPLLAYNLLQSMDILTGACHLLATRCIAGLTANRERCQELIEQSLAMCTALAPRIGYDKAAQIAKEAFATGRTVREIAQKQQALPPQELDKVLHPYQMTLGGRPGEDLPG